MEPGDDWEYNVRTIIVRTMVALSLIDLSAVSQEHARSVIVTEANRTSPMDRFDQLEINEAVRRVIFALGYHTQGALARPRKPETML